MKTKILYLLILLSVFACSKDDPIEMPEQPSVPILTVPEEMAVDVSHHVTFEWQACEDKNGDGLEYSLFYNTKPQNWILAGKTKETKFRLKLEPQTTYYWYVSATDGSTYPAESNNHVFKTGNRVKQEMVFVQGGTFQMGDEFGDLDADCRPVHNVTLNDYSIGKYEVTHAQYIEFLNDIDIQTRTEGEYEYVSNNGVDYLRLGWTIESKNGKFQFKANDYFHTDETPMAGVGIHGAAAYCKWAGGRLPTEAEWEYAARGGNKSKGYKYSGGNNPDEVGWFDMYLTCNPVGTKLPNELGIYDMTGNVSEWCRDIYDRDYYKYSSDFNPQGSRYDSYNLTYPCHHVLRGGHTGAQSFGYSHERVASRNSSHGDGLGGIYGFRIVISEQDEDSPSISNVSFSSNKLFKETTISIIGENLSEEILFEIENFRKLRFVNVNSAKTELVFKGIPTGKEGDKKGIIKNSQGEVIYNILHYFKRPDNAKNFDYDVVFVEGGTFQMGNENGYSDQKPVHDVVLDDFYIGKYEVTQEQWLSIMEENPSHFIGEGENLPVESISWDDIQYFISYLKAITKKDYRLPTEAEWEYAARGGNKSKGYKYSGSDNINDIASENKEQRFWTPPNKVGLKQANELGIYDMTGNVWEYCFDLYDSNYYSYSPVNNPRGSVKALEWGAKHVIRGGSNYKICSTTERNAYRPMYDTQITIGFRLIEIK